MSFRGQRAKEGGTRRVWSGGRVTGEIELIWARHSPAAVAAVVVEVVRPSHSHVGVVSVHAVYFIRDKI